MTTVPRKPTIITSGLDANLAHALQPVKDSIEMITGAKKGQPEIVGLSGYVAIADVVNKINEIISRINASGTAKLNTNTIVDGFFDAVYPVGSIVCLSTDKNPKDYFPRASWTSLGVLVVDSSGESIELWERSL